MKSRILFLSILSLCIFSCSSNPTPPAVENLTLTHSSVVTASTNTLGITYRVSALKTGSGYVTDAISSVVSLPVGATYVPGTSAILPSIKREPDVIGTCPDGRTYLLYNFKAGEIPDIYHFTDFSAAIGFDMTLQLVADQQSVVVSVDVTAPADPCGPLTGDSIKLVVKAS